MVYVYSRVGFDSDTQGCFVGKVSPLFLESAMKVVVVKLAL